MRHISLSPIPVGCLHQNPQRTGEPTAVQKAKIEPIKRLSLDLPQSLHTRFKTACSATRRKMGNELRDFIAARTEELEKEAGVAHK